LQATDGCGIMEIGTFVPKGGMTTMKRKETEKLEQYRLEMVRLGLEFGFDHPSVMEWSRLLDQLHNQWNKESKQSKQSKNSKTTIRRFPDNVKERQKQYA
jgi:hypothetical protein